MLIRQYEIIYEKKKQLLKGVQEETQGVNGAIINETTPMEAKAVQHF